MGSMTQDLVLKGLGDGEQAGRNSSQVAVVQKGGRRTGRVLNFCRHSIHEGGAVLATWE